MRINGIIKGYTPVFKSVRTDKKTIGELKNGTNPILDNKTENIRTALNNFTKNTDRDCIQYLLDVAEHIRYGQGGNSEFREIIDETTTAGEERENTDWLELLSSTIKKALDSSKDDVSDLQGEYDRIFNTKRPLTSEQTDILEKRKILHSKVINQGQTLNDSQTLTRTAKILKNIDYFISSSEISDIQKQKCLDLFLYFMSDEYKINPQLEDKRLQVIEEMLDDMLIKTPESKILTTKTVDQKYSGICAAIAICRKAVAYEDKVRYMEIVLDELKDSPYMSVYDVTALGTGKKIEIPKIKIDYKSALAQGYRILDASAHIWMQNSHTAGNSSIQTENYIAFEPESYGIYDDSSWYIGINPELEGEKKLLQALIKEKEALDSVLKVKNDIKSANQQIGAVKKEVIFIQGKINASLNSTLKSLFPDKTQTEITKIRQNLGEFYKGKNGNEANIAKKMPGYLKIGIISDYLKQQGNVSVENEQELRKKSKLILQMLSEYDVSDKKLIKLKKYNSKRGLYLYYKKLFDLAAADRLAIEADINLEDGVTRYEKLLGLPPRNIQIVNYLKGLKNNQNEEIKKDIESDILKIEAVIPHNLDNIAKKFFGMDVKGLTKSTYESILESVKQGDSDIIDDVAMTFYLDNNKEKVINFLNKQISKLNQNNVSAFELQDSIRMLGYENPIQLIYKTVSNYIDKLENGISEKEYKDLIYRFGGEDNITDTINSMCNKIDELLELYNNIQEKWNVPLSSEEIIRKKEKDKSIISKNDLRILYNRFMQIRKRISEQENIENLKDRQKAEADLYEFTNEEIEILKLIEKNIPNMKKYCIRAYNALNQGMKEDLEKLYSDIGMISGQFWVGEEGSTGLSTNEEIRIMEQMTDRPYHKETDIENAVKEIRKGQGSGIIAYSVDDKDYAFHAQYVPSVTSETFYSPKTGEKHIQDVIWTDNSWGNSEKKYFWNGRDGFYYTDYNSGYGWKKGFIISEDGKIGHRINTIKNSVGFNAKERERFQLVSDMILPGTPVEAYQKLYKMFQAIINMDQNEKFLEQLESILKKGYKIDNRYLEGIDGCSEVVIENLRKKVSELKSVEDFEKLPEDDYLRFVLELLSLYKSTNNPELKDSVLYITTKEELEQQKEEFLKENIDEIASIFAKSNKSVDNLFVDCIEDIKNVFTEIEQKYNMEFDDDSISENSLKIFSDIEIGKNWDGSIKSLEKALLNETQKVSSSLFENPQIMQYFNNEVEKIIKEKIDTTLRIKDLNSSVLQSSPLYEMIINAVDKYMNPKSDEDLLEFLIGLQDLDKKTADKFFDMFTYEDVGLNFKHPYEYVKKLQHCDGETNIDFYEVVTSNYIARELEGVLKNRHFSNLDQVNEDEIVTPEELYRHIYVKLSELDVQKYIKKYAVEYFNKYKVRQAFPQPVVISDENICETLEEFFKYIEKQVGDVETLNYIIEVLNDYEDITKYLKSISLYSALQNQEYYKANDEKSINEIKKLKEKILDFKNLIDKDASFPGVADSLKNIYNFLSTPDGIIDCVKISKELDNINEIMNVSDILKLNESLEIRRKIIDELNKQIGNFVNSNIEPSHRQLAIKKLKTVVNLIKKGADEDVISESKDDFTDFTLAKHILKNPPVMLREWVRLLQEGKSESVEFHSINNYIKEALKVAQQTNIQYKLVQNAHDGISSKTSDLLSMFSVKLEDGPSLSMDSNVGMLYLIEQLNNISDNNQTLRLFLNQTGLGQRALNALIDHFDFQDIYNSAVKIANEVKKDFIDFYEIYNLSNQFINNSNIQYKSLKDAVNNMLIFIKRKYENKESDIYNEYIKYMESIVDDNELQKVPVSMINNLISGFNSSIISSLNNSIVQKFQQLAELADDVLPDDVDLMYNIDVPKDCDEYSMRELKFKESENYREKIRDLILDISALIKSLNEQIES